MADRFEQIRRQIRAEEGTERLHRWSRRIDFWADPDFSVLTVIQTLWLAVARALPSVFAVVLGLLGLVMGGNDRILYAVICTSAGYFIGIALCGTER